MKAKTTALRGLVALMAGMEGRKSLVVVAHHFGRYPGREYYLGPRGSPDGDAARAGRPAAPRGARRRGERERRDASTASSPTTAWRCAFGGRLSATEPRDRQRRLRCGPGRDLDERDGGPRLRHREDRGPRRPAIRASCRLLEQVETDLGSFYSIGFPAAGGTRSRRVSVRVKRPGLSRRTRRDGRREDGRGAACSDRALANLFAPDERSRIAISVVAGEARPKGKEVPDPDRGEDPRRVARPPPRRRSPRKGKFSVFVVVATPNGDFTDVTRRRQTFEVRGERRARRAPPTSPTRSRSRATCRRRGSPSESGTRSAARPGSPS